MNEKARSMLEYYPLGTRMELIDMANFEVGMPPGLRGTVVGCDDQPSLQMLWDNGRSLSLLMGDSYRKLRPDEVDAEQYGNITAVCDKCPSLCNYREYPARDYAYTFEEIDDPETLAEHFEHGNWDIRTGFLYGGLAFVQQVNGGDEWLALRQSQPGQWESFESISFGHILLSAGEDELLEYVSDIVEEHGVLEVDETLEAQGFGGMGGMA
ncbi:MAG: DUF4314 domain-containing protein [Oscillospiraceae bacterium]|jgi:hypothetical protein|nr:DUF4314 domain-containing protein [Oscillospiraceae bacterium]